MQGNEIVAVTRPFAREDRLRSVAHVVSTFGLLALATACAALAPHWALRVIGSVIEGLLIVRAFILSHDFHHGALLRRSIFGKILFSVYGTLVLTPPRVWRATHNYHHAHTAKIVGAQIGSYPVMTVEMWRRASRTKRVAYRIARHPFNVVFGYLTIFLGGMCAGAFVRNPRENWDSAIAFVVHVALLVAITHFFGIEMTLLVLVGPLFIACALGSYLFYAQHNFPGIHIQPRQTWSFSRAAVESSSFMKCGPIMSFFTGDIGYHHVHHLNSVIPFYRLREAMAAIPELQVEPQTSLSWRHIRECFALKLWDPQAGKMVGFPQD